MRAGAYEVLGEIGRGGMGVVYRARSPDGRIVALKQLLAPEGGALARFERERRLLASLGTDEGFVPLLDAGESPAGPFLVMPFVGGGTLRARLANGPLEVEEAVELARTLAASLGRAHARGIVHRDLKPENVLFEESGAPLVTDLGLARHFRREGAHSLSLTASGELLGSAGYLAPEQMNDAKAVGPAADVFSLGAILYECLAGRAAFEGDSIHATFAKIATNDFEPLRRVRPSVPAWLEEVVRRALAADPARRFSDATAFARALGARGGRRRRGWKIAAGLVVLGVALVVAWRAVPRPGPVPAPVRAPAPGPVPAPVPAPAPVRRLAVPDEPFGRMTVDPATGNLILSSGYGTAFMSVVDPATGKVLWSAAGSGAVAVGETVFASTGYAGELVAIAGGGGEPRWKTRVGFCGGWVDADPETDLVYATLQCGRGDDPLVVVKGSTGEIVLAPRGTGGVISNVVVDPVEHRAYVSSGGRVLVFGPDLAVEREVPAFTALVADPVGRRIFGRSAAGDLAYLTHGAATTPMPPRSAEGPIALDARNRRLYVAEKAGVFVLDAGSLAPVQRVALDAAPRLLAVDGERGKLYAVASGNLTVVSLR